MPWWALSTDTAATVYAMTAVSRAGCALALLLASTAARAADISVAPDPGRRAGMTIYITGEILPDDDVKFRDISLLVLPTAAVVLDSPGGKTYTAINIGEQIRYKQYETVAVNRCTSACALIWLAGVPTSMIGTVNIGFHASGWADTGKESGLGNVMRGVYFAHLGFGYDAVRFFTEAPPNSMQWLTPQTAKRLGININIYSAPARPMLGY